MKAGNCKKAWLKYVMNSEVLEKKSFDSGVSFELRKNEKEYFIIRYEDGQYDMSENYKKEDALKEWSEI